MSAVESTDVSCGSVARLKNQENLRKLAVREDVGFVSVERPYSLTISCRNQSRRKEERKKKGRSDEEQSRSDGSYEELRPAAEGGCRPDQAGGKLRTVLVLLHSTTLLYLLPPTYYLLPTTYYLLASTDRRRLQLGSWPSLLGRVPPLGLIYSTCTNTLARASGPDGSSSHRQQLSRLTKSRVPYSYPYAESGSRTRTSTGKEPYTVRCRRHNIT